MACPICDQKRMNCDCTETEKRQYGEIGDLQDEIASLRLAIRRLADQDATLSVCGGNVTVQVDATLTDDEREAIHRAEARLRTAYVPDDETAATLRGLLDRTQDAAKCQ